MGSDTIWIIGSNMTRFGKHPDKDVVDLAAEASREALKDAGISLSEVGVLGVGNLMNAGAGIGQQLQKQIGQTGIPVFKNNCPGNATITSTTSFLSISSLIFPSLLVLELIDPFARTTPA